MAMFCTEEKAMISINRAVFVIAVGMTLSACTQSALRMQPDFGNALRQDIAAQIADPDARYEGTPAPGSSGPRVGLAQKRYDTNQVIPPSSVTASSKGSIGNADNGASGGAGVGASAGMSQ
jgi:hypothetical protein